MSFLWLFGEHKQELLILLLPAQFLINEISMQP